jgi:outer membrane protein assembly factor BamB
MSRLLKAWRDWPLDRRFAIIVTLVLIASSFVSVGYLTAKRPADKSCPPPCDLEVDESGTLVPTKGRGGEKDRTVDWPMFGYDAERTKYLPVQGIKPPYKPVWGWDSGELLEFSPIVVKDVVYGINNTATAFALDAKDGKVLWRKDVGGLSANSPAYDHGVLYMAALEPGSVVAVRAKDGKILWEKQLGGRTESSPIVHNGRVIVGCECARVYALDTKDGSEVWSTPTAAEVKAAVAISKGTAFVGDYAGQMYAINPADGSVRWQSSASGSGFGVAGRFYSTAAVAYGRVYVGSVDGRVYSFDAQTGSLAWSQSTGDWVYGGVVAADTPDTPPTVYAGSFDNHAYAFDAATGEVRWTRDVGAIISGAGSLIGEIYYVSTLAGRTFGLAADNGNVVWEWNRGQYNPAISDGEKLYITGYSGITAFEPKGRGGNGGGTKGGGGAGGGKSEDGGNRGRNGSNKGSKKDR